MCNVCGLQIPPKVVCYACWACACDPAPGGLMWLCCSSCAEQRPATAVSSGIGETATVAQLSVNEDDAVELTVRPEILASFTLRRYRELGLSIDPMGHEWYFIVERYLSEVSLYPFPLVPTEDYSRHCSRPIDLFPLARDLTGVDVGAVMPDFHHRWRFEEWLSAGGRIHGFADRFQSPAMKSLLLAWCDLALRSPACTRYAVKDKQQYRRRPPTQ